MAEFPPISVPLHKYLHRAPLLDTKFLRGGAPPSEWQMCTRWCERFSDLNYPTTQLLMVHASFFTKFLQRLIVWLTAITTRSAYSCWLQMFAIPSRQKAYLRIANYKVALTRVRASLELVAIFIFLKLRYVNSYSLLENAICSLGPWLRRFAVASTGRARHPFARPCAYWRW